MNNKKTIYSVFSGTFYDVPEKDVKILDIGQIPLLKNQSKNCNKCYGRGQIGRDAINLSYQICKCIRKNIDFDLIKSYLPEDKTS